MIIFSDALPEADIIVGGNIMHELDEARNGERMKNACHALPDGKALAAIEGIIV